MAPAPLNSPIPIEKRHELTASDCGVSELNGYLHRHALPNHQNRSARSYVATRGDRVVGYSTLGAGAVSRADAPSRVVRGLGAYPVPVILLARLAVDQSEQGRGLGKGLLKDALARCAQAAELIGCRAVLVHAKDHAARAFYARHGFEESPTHELHLFLLMKDLLASLGRGG